MSGSFENGLYVVPDEDESDEDEGITFGENVGVVVEVECGGGDLSNVGVGDSEWVVGPNTTLTTKTTTTTTGDIIGYACEPEEYEDEMVEMKGGYGRMML